MNAGILIEGRYRPPDIRERVRVRKNILRNLKMENIQLAWPSVRVDYPWITVKKNAGNPLGLPTKIRIVDRVDLARMPCWGTSFRMPFSAAH